MSRPAAAALRAATRPSPAAAVNSVARRSYTCASCAPASLSSPSPLSPSASSRPTAPAAIPARTSSLTLARYAHSNPWVQRKVEQREEEKPAKLVGLRNDAIPFRTVQVADASGGLGPPTPIVHLLRGLDTRTDALVLVATDPPVVKFVNLEEERAGAREREARQKLQRKLATEDKEIQVGWTAAEGDMQHKIAQARGALEKGDRAHLIFAMRANSAGGARTYVSDEDKVAIVRRFETALKDVGKRWKDDEIGKGLWVCYWAPAEAVAAEVRSKVVSSELEKKRLRDEKKEARKAKEEERLRRAAARKAGKA